MTTFVIADTLLSSVIFKTVMVSLHRRRFGLCLIGLESCIIDIDMNTNRKWKMIRLKTIINNPAVINLRRYILWTNTMI